MSTLASPLSRVVLLAAAAAIVLSVYASRGDQRACAEAGARLFRSLAPGQPAGATAQPRADLLERGCTDSRPLLASAMVLSDAGRTRQALPLARRVVKDEPENAAAWLALARALRRSDPARARAAVNRARELNPLAVSRPRR